MTAKSAHLVIAYAKTVSAYAYASVIAVSVLSASAVIAKTSAIAATVLSVNVR